MRWNFERRQLAIYPCKQNPKTFSFFFLKAKNFSLKLHFGKKEFLYFKACFKILKGQDVFKNNLNRRGVFPKGMVV